MKLLPAKSINGTVKLPGDKSISHRAAMFASIADGSTEITNYLAAEDCLTTIECMRALGVDIERNGTAVRIIGRGLNGLCPSDGTLDCGNSGTTARLISGILAGQAFDTTLTGDASLTRRPMKRIIEPLASMGAVVESVDGKMPLTIRGSHLRGLSHSLKVASAQVKSCILLAGLYASGITTVIEPTPTRDHTERMLRWLGATVSVESDDDGSRISLTGGQTLNARDISVPSDVSSAAFFLMAAACLPGSSVQIPNVGLNPTRDGIVEVLRQVGVDIEVRNARENCNEAVADLYVRGGITQNSGENVVISGPIIANIIDEIPVLAVLGTQLAGGLEVRGAAELRVKETDRIDAIVKDLKKMGAVITELEDGFRVERSQLRGAVVDSFGDHRIAMAMAVAALVADGETTINDAECSAISFPAFFETLSSVVR